MTDHDPTTSDESLAPDAAEAPVVDAIDEVPEPEEPDAEAPGGAAAPDGGEPPAAEGEPDEASTEDVTEDVAPATAEDEGLAAAAVALEPETDPGAGPLDLPRPRRRRLRLAGMFAVSFAAAALIGSSVGAAAMYAYRSSYDGRVPQGVDIAGIDLSGLDVASAQSLVLSSFPELTQGTIVLDAPSGDRVIEFADFGRSVDARGAVERAMAITAGGGLIDQTIASARTAIDGVSIAPTVTLDPVLLSATIDTALRGYVLPPRDAIVTSSAQGVEIQPARTGWRVDRDTIVANALAQVSSLDAPSVVTVPVELIPIEPDVTDAEASAARLGVDRMAKQIVLQHGDESWKVAAKTVRSWIDVNTTADGRIELAVDEGRVSASLAKLRAKIDRKPVDASYLTANTGRVIGVRASRNGRTVDLPATSSQVVQAVMSRVDGSKVSSAKLTVKAVAPKLSTAEAEKTAPLLKMISGHTTWFPYGERNFFGANIWIPGRIINGTVLAPGQTFDFWKVVGFPSASRGFGAGGAIINGRTEPTGALAGGICSCSTTLFNAAAKAGLKLGARRMHYYYIDRYPLGLDATVWISGGSRQNMTFTNDTKHPILIVNRNWRSGGRGYIRFELWSVPNGRKVSFSRPIVRNVRPATTSVVYTSALRPGASVQDESEHDGMDVWVTRTVTAGGKVIHKDTIRSHYARVNGVILRGRAADAAGTGL
jgi:vancomycin resistance protein YoaR